MRPLLGADEKAMQRIHHGIAPALFLRVARWQEDEHVAIDGITFEIPLECRSMDLDAFHGDGFGAGDHGRRFGLHLRGGGALSTTAASAERASYATLVIS